MKKLKFYSFEGDYGVGHNPESKEAIHIFGQKYECNKKLNRF